MASTASRRRFNNYGGWDPIQGAPREVPQTASRRRSNNLKSVYRKQIKTAIRRKIDAYVVGSLNELAGTHS